MRQKRWKRDPANMGRRRYTHSTRAMQQKNATVLRKRPVRARRPDARGLSPEPAGGLMPVCMTDATERRPAPAPSTQPHLTRRAAMAATSAAMLLAPAGLRHGASAQGTAATSASEPPARRLVAAPTALRLRPAPSNPTAVWAFDGAVPGPVLRVRQGESLRIELENRTPAPLSLHWHGVRGAAAMDGVGGFSQPPVAPGERFDYRLTPPDAGTFLYRPLVIGGSSEPAGRGLTGMLIVEEKSPPVVDLDLPVLVADWLLGDDNAMAAFPSGQQHAAAGRLGSWITSNGAAPPLRLAGAPGARVRLRLANGCNARITRLRFDGAKVFVAAVDGQPTDAFEPVRAQLPFPPGSRYDIMLDMPEEPGEAVTVMALSGPGVPLVRLVAEGQKRRPAHDPLAGLALNPTLPAAVRLQDARRIAMLIEGGARVTPESRLDLSGVDPERPWRINGATGDAKAPPLFSVRRGTPVVIAIDNRTAFAQPMHVHGHVFRLLHPLDDGWEPYFLDTLQVPEGRRLHIAFIAENPGRWLISSSVLERFDRGLWSWFEVT